MTSARQGSATCERRRFACQRLRERLRRTSGRQGTGPNGPAGQNASAFNSWPQVRARAASRANPATGATRSTGSQASGQQDSRTAAAIKADGPTEQLRSHQGGLERDRRYIRGPVNDGVGWAIGAGLVGRPFRIRRHPPFRAGAAVRQHAQHSAAWSGAWRDPRCSTTCYATCVPRRRPCLQDAGPSRGCIRGRRCHEALRSTCAATPDEREGFPLRAPRRARNTASWSSSIQVALEGP